MRIGELFLFLLCGIFLYLFATSVLENRPQSYQTETTFFAEPPKKAEKKPPPPIISITKIEAPKAKSPKPETIIAEVKQAVQKRLKKKAPPPAPIPLASPEPPTKPSSENAALVIFIGGVGLAKIPEEVWRALPKNVSLGIVPLSLPNSWQKKRQTEGKEIILHLPMDGSSYSASLDASLPMQKNHERLDTLTAYHSHIKGIIPYRGEAFTIRPQKWHELSEMVKAQGLYLKKPLWHMTLPPQAKSSEQFFALKQAEQKAKSENTIIYVQSLASEPSLRAIIEWAKFSGFPLIGLGETDE